MTAGVVASKVREKREKDNHLVWSLGLLCLLGVMLCNVWLLLGILPGQCLIFFSRFVLCCQNQDPRQAKKPRKRRQVGAALNL